LERDGAHSTPICAGKVVELRIRQRGPKLVVIGARLLAVFGGVPAIGGGAPAITGGKLESVARRRQLMQRCPVSCRGREIARLRRTIA
jgi:hypothetical protein